MYQLCRTYAAKQCLRNFNSSFVNLNPETFKEKTNQNYEL